MIACLEGGIIGSRPPNDPPKKKFTHPIHA